MGYATVFLVLLNWELSFHKRDAVWYCFEFQYFMMYLGLFFVGGCGAFLDEKRICGLSGGGCVSEKKILMYG
ncbi:MAG: hypothetical protein CR994_06075 [Maribacter sp.]|nr:MAG: hypothetical protein CR994_06075 [Maribacter sp.]